MSDVERYWPFTLVCLAFAVMIGYLLLRRRVTLQASLTYLLLLVAIGVASIFSPTMAWLSSRLGFALPSNFFFAISIGALSLLHLLALISQSRADLRTIALAQELALVSEQVQALKAQLAGDRAPPPVPPSSTARA